MAAPRPVRDSDTALWLHNKLGSSEELWVSSSIGGIIKTDTIDNIFRCFPVLNTTVKMKLLLGILHLPRRSLEEMKHTIDGLVELALDDVDQWVKLIANVVKTYPMMCKLNLDLSTNQIAANVIQQLEEKVKDSDVFATLPLECQYVNRNALQNLVGNQPPPRRHFALKRKPKSAALRVDLMQKSTNASSQVKKGSGFNKIVPVKHRDMTRKLSDASPMRGIPKTPGGPNRSEGFRTQSTPSSHMTPGAASRTASRFSSRAERGTKLLDISEQPLGIREQKRRKKQQQEEESQQVQPEEKVDELPDYASGLVPATMAQSTLPEEESTSMETEKDNQQMEQEENDDEMEDEEYPSHYSPERSPNKISMNYSSIDQEEQEPVSAPSPPPETVSPKKVVTEKRPSIEDYPVYAMPATPSPYFKPVPTPTISASPIRPKTMMSSPNTPSSRTSTTSSSSSPSPVRKKQEQIINIPATPTNTVIQQPRQQIQIPTPSQRLQSPQTNVPTRNIVTQDYPQVPRFYSPPTQTTQQVPVQQQQAATRVQQQATTRVQQPATVLHGYPGGIYRPQIPVGVRPGMQYIVSPNMVQRTVQLQQQIQAQNLQFSPASTVLQGQLGGAAAQAANTQLLQHQLQMQQQQAAAAAQQAALAQQQQTQKKELTITREQMMQAQDMFRTANRLSRQEKAIILGFMAGSRDNPSPDKGDIVQITLSEHEQQIQNPSDGALIPVVVETFFEMNYRTGATAKKQRLRQVVGR